jgi:hypothetical protein
MADEKFHHFRGTTRPDIIVVEELNERWARELETRQSEWPRALGGNLGGSWVYCPGSNGTNDLQRLESWLRRRVKTVRVTSAGGCAWVADRAVICRDLHGDDPQNFRASESYPEAQLSRLGAGASAGLVIHARRGAVGLVRGRISVHPGLLGADRPFRASWTRSRSGKTIPSC